MKVCVVLVAAKSAGRLSRLLRRGDGNAAPGRVAEFLYPELATVLARQLSQVIIVTGTNGKTTTTKLLDEMLALSGERVVANRSGSNMKQGIVSALVSDARISGGLSGDRAIGLFEVDEATVPLVIRSIGADHVVVTNLFRDQLDRYGEIDTLVNTLGGAIEGTDAQVYLNVDDPMVASLSRFVSGDQVTYFGLEMAAGSVESLKTAVDSVHCPRCGTKLRFDRRFYSHLGHYQCPQGDCVRPPPAIAVASVDDADTDGCTFTLLSAGVQYRAEMSLVGLFNVYNALAALTVARGIGVSTTTALQSLKAAKAAFGRVEDIDCNGRLLRLILVKNPAGFTQVLDTFLRTATSSNILIAVNDLEADGRDVSWLWDVPFEFLADRGHRIVVTGGRAGDVAVRLHYADINPTSVIADIPDAVDEVLRRTQPGDRAYLFTNYTPMLAVREHLGRLVDMTPIGTEQR